MTLSTTEAKYIATLDEVKEAIWLPRLSTDSSAKRRLDLPTLTIYNNCDSLSTIHLIRNLMYHAKMKHIEVQFHHIRELAIEKKLEVWKIDT